MAVAAVGRSYELEIDRDTGVVALKQTTVVAVAQQSRAAPALSPVQAPVPRLVTPIRRYQPEHVQTRHRRGTRCTAGNIALIILMLVISLAYGTVTFLSAEMYYSCPDRRMALYTVIQGSFAMFNCGMCALWLMLRCVSYKPILCIWILIFLFNVAWSIVGAIWIKDSPCQELRLKWYAIGSSIPMWFALFSCCKLCCCRDDD